MTFTFHWYMIPIVVLGIGLCLAAWLGKLWADRDEEQRRWVEECRRKGWRP